MTEPEETTNSGVGDSGASPVESPEKEAEGASWGTGIVSTVVSFFVIRWAGVAWFGWSPKTSILVAAGVALLNVAVLWIAVNASQAKD